EQLTRTRAREHVDARLRHVGVRMAWTLVAAAEDTLHGAHVDNVLPRGGGGCQGCAQLRDQDERRGLIGELHLEHLKRVDLVDALLPRVGAGEVGYEAARVNGRSRSHPL